MMCDGFHSRMYSQIGPRSGNEGGELAIILTANLLDGNNGCRLLVDDRSEASLSLNDDVWDTHFSTESRKENDEFDGVDVMRDNDERCLLGLDQSNDVVEAIFRINGFFCVLAGGPVNPVVKSQHVLTFWASLPLAVAVAVAVRRAFFSFFVSGRYLSSNLNNCVAVFLSRVCENCAMAGGTFKRWERITFCRCRRMYSGHFTKRVRSRRG